MDKEDLLSTLMEISIKSAEQAFDLSKELNQLDSQEFIDWQDALNVISVKYEE